jgi:hypothetical protein
VSKGFKRKLLPGIGFRCRRVGVHFYDEAFGAGPDRRQR